MKKILKYKDWFSTIGLILFIAFSRRLLDNEWAVYAGQTLLVMSLNLEFLNDKREDGKIGIYNTIAALFITGSWIGLTYYMIKDYLL
uniref:hypothetical protein n=1 Tax=Prevotella sp. TaxID=59823 RepID=UPI004026AF71